VSSGALKLLRVKRACEAFERTRDILIAAIDRRDSRTCLDAFVELAELHLEQTGGTLHTESYRAQLATLRARVALVPALTLLSNPTPVTPEESPEMIEIEVAMPCLAPDCAGHGYVRLTSGGYQCTCTECFDPTEDGPYICQLAGHGSTPEAAVATWAEALQEAGEIEFWPTSMAALARAEFKRQSRWVWTHTELGSWYAPEELTRDACDYCANDGHTYLTREARCEHWDGAQ
jgi:hypothetical protein